MKRIVSIVILIFILTGILAQSFATNKEIINSASTKNTEQFLVTITRPDADEATYKKIYAICGNTNKEDIMVELMIYDNSIGRYKPLYTLEETNIFQIGESGLFAKEVELQKQGTNIIRIVAFKKNTTNWQLGKNVQLNDFNINVVDKGFQDVFKNGFFKLSDMLSQLFK